MEVIETKLIKTNNKPLPLYRQIVQHLKNQINTEKAKVGERLPNISQMVRIWGVEYGTVKTAIKTLEKAGMVKYEGKGKGPLIVKKSSSHRTLTILFPRRCANAQFSDLIRGMQKYNETKDINLIVTDSLSDEKVELNTLANLSPEIDGLILFPVNTPEYHDALNRILKSGLKIVFVDRFLPDLPVSSVFSDNFDGAYQATAHLIKETKRPVYYYGETKDTSSCQQRFSGWQAAMRDYNYSDTAGYICEPPISEAEAYKIHFTAWVELAEKTLLNFFKSGLNNVSIFAVNDDSARFVCLTAEKTGLKPGKDFFIAGFGEKPFCTTLDIPLTSVSQNDEKVGFEAAKLLYEHISGIQKTPVHKVLPVQLNVRQSSVIE